MQQVADSTPWYRQFWPWFIIALPASAVIAGIATVIIATQNQDTLVVDDYYKEGLAINQSIERDRLAQELGISALLRSQPSSNQLFIKLSSRNAEHRPDQINLQITHPTLQQNDQQFTLRHEGDGMYSMPLESPTAGSWHILIEPIDRTWRLTGRMDLAHGGQTQLPANH